MRTRNGYVGATLLYGTEPPVLPHVLQFLLHDLYLEGRAVGGVQLKGTTLRLRFDGYEMILTQSDRPLPPRAFEGALRPRRAGGASCPTPAHYRQQEYRGPGRNRQGDGQSGGQGDGGQVVADLARGRVLHALRNHRHALSVLLRARGGRRSDDPPDAFVQLTGECRAMLEAVIEATPPRAVVWQPGAVAFTCEEFLATRAETLLESGDRANVLCLSAHSHAAADRPALLDWSLPDTAPRPAPVAAPGTARQAIPAPPVEAGSSPHATSHHRAPQPAARESAAPVPPAALTGDILFGDDFGHDQAPPPGHAGGKARGPHHGNDPRSGDLHNGDQIGGFAGGPGDWATDSHAAALPDSPAEDAPLPAGGSAGDEGAQRQGARKRRGPASNGAPPHRSAGRLFGTGRQPGALPRLYRQDERLAQALRAHAPTARPAPAQPPRPAASRPAKLARLINGLTLLLSGLLLAPVLGLF